MALGQDLAFESLDEKARSAALWRIVCEAYMKKSTLKIKGEVDKFVKESLVDMAKPVHQYEVLLTLDNIDIRDNVISLWGYEFLAGVAHSLLWVNCHESHSKLWGTYSLHGT